MKKLIQDFKDTRVGNEDFLYWFLVRKLSLGGKLFLSAILWALFFKYGYNLWAMILLFEGAILLSLLTGIVWLIQFFIKKSKGRQRK